MKKSILLLCSLTLIVATGCETTGWSSNQRNKNSYSHYVLKLARDHSPSDGTQPGSPRLPMQLAVGQIGESAPQQSLLDTLEKEHGLFSRVIPVPIPGDEVGPNGQHYASNLDEEISGVLKLSKNLNADYLLIAGGTIESTTNPKPWVLLDCLTLGVTATFIPSHTIRGSGKASAVLIDLRTEKVVSLYSAGSARKKTSPTFFTDQHKELLINRLKRSLGDDLGKEFVQTIRQEPVIK